MRTDSIFNRFFRIFPDAFFIMIGQDARKAKKYKFKSVEVKELAFRFDGIFLPKTKDEFLYFTEVQFAKETDFYLRFFGEIAVYLHQYQPEQPWRAVVLFPDESVDTGIEQHYAEFFKSGRLTRLYLVPLLKKYPEQFPLNLLKIIIDSKKDVPETVKKIIEQLPKKIPDAKTQEVIIDLLINVLMSKFPTLSREEIEKMVEPLLSDVKKSRAYQEYKAEIEQELGPRLKKELTPRLKKELTPKLRKELTPKLKKELSRKLAKTLLQKKMEIAFVAEVTELTTQEVVKLSQQLSRHKN